MQLIYKFFSNNILENISIVYIFLPYFIFAIGWLKIYYCIFFVAVIGIAICLYLSTNLEELTSKKERKKIDKNYWLNLSSSFAIIVAWISLSGIGGYGYQHTDWIKHNAILKDLIFNSWPVAYLANDLPNQVNTLVYYIAFYLPSAVIGKAFGWNAANHSLLIWALCGTLLSIAWFLKLVKQKYPSISSIVLVLFFIVCGGMDFIGWAVLEGYFYIRDNGLIQGLADDKEWWVGIWQYSANTTLLFWVPQHAIPGWILTAMVLNEAMNKKSSANLGFLIAGSTLWSPFVSIGLVPLLIFGLSSTRFKNVISFQNLITAPILALLLGLFYISSLGRIPHGLVFTLHQVNILFLLGGLILFLLAEFVIYATLCSRAIRKNSSKNEKRLYLLVLVCLILIPIYKMGMYNDFVMRASIPSLFIFWFFIAGVIFNTDSRNSITITDVKRTIQLTIIFLGLTLLRLGIKLFIYFSINKVLASALIVIAALIIMSYKIISLKAFNLIENNKKFVVRTKATVIVFFLFSSAAFSLIATSVLNLPIKIPSLETTMTIPELYRKQPEVGVQYLGKQQSYFFKYLASSIEIAEESKIYNH